MVHAKITNDEEKTIITIWYDNGRVTKRELNLNNAELVQKICDRYIIDHNDRQRG